MKNKDKTKTVVIFTVLFAVIAFNSVDKANAEDGTIPGVTTEMVSIKSFEKESTPSSFANNTEAESASASTAAEEDEPSLHVGGAVRYNLILQAYESDIDGNSGDFTWDTWRINAVYDNPGGIGLNFEYRFYPTFDTHFIKQGWLEYDLTDEWQTQLGVAQVPFGNLQYNSNNWWFQLPYYVGLEDDHNMGIKFTNTTEDYQLDFAYFYSQEPFGPPGYAGTYSYNVNPSETIIGSQASLIERNQFNIRGAYNIDAGEIGASLEVGQLYNQVTDEFDGRFAGAVHGEFNIGGLNIKPQVLYYSMDAHDDAGNELEAVGMGAYGVSADFYHVATEAYIASLGIARNVSVDIGPITDLTFYNDFSYMGKLVGEDFTGDDNFEATIHNITGFLITAGPVFTYVDVAQGVNQPWLTDSFGTGLGPGHEDLGMGDSEYNMRFNINIGYYF